MNKKEKEYWKEIKNIEKKFSDITKEFDLSFPKPLNGQEQRKIFFGMLADDKFYNPQFEYEKRTYDEKAINKLKKLKIDTKNDLYGFKIMYKDKVKAKIAQVECFKNWGKQESTKLSIGYYGKPSRLVLRKAKKFCKNYKREKVKFKTLTPKIAGNRLKKEVKRLTGDKIDVKYVDLPNKLNLSPSKHLIRINPNERFTSRDVRRLKVHEIGTHFMRYWNGNQSGFRILATGGTYMYAETEEGLASYMEELKGVSSNAQMYIYAGRVIATYYAQKKDFVSIFKILKSYGFNNETAFTMTFRAKRNICDTSLAGGFIKDHSYFQGYLKVKKFAKRNDITELFIGKITIKMHKKLRKYILQNKDRIRTVIDDDLINT